MPRRSSAKASRGRLSRERILSAALQIVDDEGLPGLTIRRLAGELDVTPMAVYRHFRNKAEIMDGLIEVVVAEGAAAEHETEGWREWLVETFLRMRDSLIAHPGVMPLMGTSASYGVHSLRIAEQVLARLRASGMSDDTVARAMHVLVAYTLGAVAIEIAAREQRSEAEKVDSTEWQRQMRVRFESASIAEFPNLVTLAPKLAEFVQTERFVHGLDRIIDGFVANPADD